MKFIIKNAKGKAVSDDNYNISGVIEPEEGETTLYKEMIAAYKEVANSESAIQVVDEKLLLVGITLPNCRGILDLFHRNFDVDFKISFAKNAKITPKGSDELIKMELRS